MHDIMKRNRLRESMVLYRRTNYLSMILFSLMLKDSNKESLLMEFYPPNFQIFQEIYKLLYFYDFELLLSLRVLSNS